jgi:hypothetical protein
MKPIFFIAIILFFTAGADAQTGMPQSLSCTETAFNFSFSLGSKWKFSAPKMGPVEIRKMDKDISAWSLKMKIAKRDTNYTSSHDSTNYRNHPKFF